MLWVYGHYKYFTLSVPGSTVDVIFWRLIPVPALKGLPIFAFMQHSAVYFEKKITYVKMVVYNITTLGAKDDQSGI